MADAEPDVNQVSDTPMETALGAGDNKTDSMTDMAQRNIDMRSGNLVVRNEAGKIIELGIQPDGSYGLSFFNPSSGLGVAVFGKETDGSAVLKFLNSDGNNVAQFGEQADGTASLKFFNNSGNTVAQFGEQADDSYGLKFFDVLGVGLAQFGQFPSGSVALKVAKSGYEVSTATNDQLIFNSSQDIFKIVSTGTSTITGGSSSSTNGSYSATVTHNLGYVPIVMAYAIGYASSLQPLPMIRSASSRQHNTADPNNGFFFAIDQWVYFNATTTTVVFSIDWSNSGYPSSYVVDNLSINYYLLQETAV